ncbi:hypothetical protein C100_15005 [Sphingobium sp. C100]|jgi:uncharacterized phiE125 gp8 family phage protein|uniref:head-tail connector protein n=1 Tax=Sphingobium sp. C100 TaxID=1207055 RepID=UPI0003D6673F|nr:head-tail connector protein [Sphingobium sp. C100]ETI63009.1 hypothetical protein C100_15005 [Sphingobium sp. C100]
MAEPITLDQAKAQLRVDGDDDNEVIASAIVAARGWVERYTGLILTRRQVRETIPQFGHRLRAWPVISVDGVTFLDHARASQSLSVGSFVPDLMGRPARLLADRWPRQAAGSKIEVLMTAGFEDADAINDYAPPIMQAIRQLVASFYHDRETGGIAGDAEEAAKDLCRSYRNWAV